MLKIFFKSAFRNLLRHKGFASILIALITVIFQSYKAALANPAEALKYE